MTANLYLLVSERPLPVYLLVGERPLPHTPPTDWCVSASVRTTQQYTSGLFSTHSNANSTHDTRLAILARNLTAHCKKNQRLSAQALLNHDMWETASQTGHESIRQAVRAWPAFRAGRDFAVVYNGLCPCNPCLAPGIPQASPHFLVQHKTRSCWTQLS